MCGSREGKGFGSPLLKNHKAIGFLSNIGVDPLENHKTTKPAFNVGPLPAKRHLMAFRWWVDNGPLLVIFGYPSPLHINKKQQQKTLTKLSWTPSKNWTKKLSRLGWILSDWQNFLDPRMLLGSYCLLLFLHRQYILFCDWPDFH